MLALDSKSNKCTLLVSFSVFLFYAINQSVPSGYSYGASLLLLISLFYMSKRPVLGLAAEDKIYLSILVCFFVVAVFVCILHGNPLRTLDAPSRFLLAIPIFLLLLKVPPRLPWLWAGIAVGSYSACSVAVWQLHVLGMNDVDGLTNGVRFGAVSTALGVFCAAGLTWAHRGNVQHVWLWRLMLALGVITAGYGSITSGTRGAWISLPVVFVLFCVGLFTQHNLRRACAASVALVVAICVWYVTVPNNPIQVGYQRAVQDVEHYMDGNADSSVGARLELVRAILANAPKKPMLGWSVHDYRAQLEQQVANKTLHPIVLQLSHSHNLFLETLIYTGVVGLIPMLALFISPFWFFCRRLRASQRNVRILAITGASHVVMTGVLGASHVVLYRNDMLLFFFITLMTLWGCLKRAEARTEKEESMQ